MYFHFKQSHTHTHLVAEGKSKRLVSTILTHATCLVMLFGAGATNPKQFVASAYRWNREWNCISYYSYYHYYYYQTCNSKKEFNYQIIKIKLRPRQEALDALQPGLETNQFWCVPYKAWVNEKGTVWSKRKTMSSKIRGTSAAAAASAATDKAGKLN